MDRRTIAAIFIIVLIFILTPYYYKWIGIEPKNKTMATKDTTETFSPTVDSIVPVREKVSVEAEKEVSIPIGTKLDWLKDDGDTSKIIVETDQYKAVFSGKRAGNLESFYLKKYNYFQGGWVNLIDSNYFDIEFSGSGGEPISLSTVNATVVEGKVDSIYLNKGEKHKITFALSDRNGNRIYERTFLTSGDNDGIRVISRILQFDMIGHGQYYRIGWKKGIPVTEEILSQDLQFKDAVVYMGDELEYTSADKEEKNITYTGRVDWISSRNKYFSIFLRPMEFSDVEGAFIRAYSTTDSLGHIVDKRYDIMLSVRRKGTMVELDSLVLFPAPLDHGYLKQYGAGFEKLVLNKRWDERFLRPLTLMFISVFKLFYSVIPNYGIVIILFSLLLKILLFPLTKKSYQSMKEMQLLQPVINEIREKYKDNPQKMNQELMGIYKKYGINPMGGCLPMLLQMPILFALFVVFRSTIELRGQPFVLWITDLSSPDKLFLEISLPFIGNSIHVLPILSAVSMIYQSKMQGTGSSQNKILVYLMPIMFMFLLYNFPSGLHLYYFVFNILTFIQQKFIKEPIPLHEREMKWKEKEQKSKKKR